MASMTEFYLTSVWLYKPPVVKRIIDDLVALGCEHAEFTYDGEYNWFKVICLEDDSYTIRRTFAKLARKIETEAFDEHEDRMLYTDDTLVHNFENEWFTMRPPGDYSSFGTDESDVSYSRPSPLATHAHSAVWNELDNNNEPYTIGDILNLRQFQAIKEALGVELRFGPAGKLIDIAANNEESIHQARNRLRVLLTIRKLLDCSPRTVNLLYAEGYADPADQLEPGAAPVFDADIRYLANIDPKLPSSTLLDGLAVDDLEVAYKTLYATASSIRLCRWNPDKKYRLPLLGPKAAVQCKGRTVWGNRPAVSTKEISGLSEPFEDLGSRGPSQDPVAVNLVETWIKDLPAQTGFAAGADTHGPLGDQLPAKPSQTTMSESLIDFTEPVTPSPGTPVAASSKTLVDSTATGGTQISPLCQDVSAKSREEPAAVRTSSPMDSLRPSIQWEMPPLVPSPPRNERDEGTANGSDQVSSTTTDSPSKGGEPVSPLEKDKGHSLQATTVEKKTGPSRKDKALGSPPRGPQPVTKQSPKRQAGKLKTQNSSKPATTPNQPAGAPPSQLPNPSHLAAAAQFINEIETAMIKALSLGPYRRGKVGFRAELGRSILEAVDPSGLAFNSASAPCNGWKKPTLIKKLNKEYGENQDIQFTKILSTFGCDVESMVNAKVNGMRLWEQQPKRSWTTYSFHCSLRSTSKLGRFIVDIEDDGTSRGIFSYSIRPHLDVFPPDQPNPIYVHAIQRNWDLRIATTHVETDEAEMAYGPFANTLLHSLSVSEGKKGVPEVKFAVYNDSAVDVNEVRVLTKWRHLSLDHNSALEITEVQQTEMKPYAEGFYSGTWDTWEGTLARPWSKRRAKEERSRGEFPLWYEASVVSLELEDILEKNLLLQVGEKADWDPLEVNTRGFLKAIYLPALEMVKAMDHVGREDDNHQSAAYAHLLRRGNDHPPRVPGAIPVQVQQTRGQGCGEGSGAARGADTQSTRSGVTSVRASSGRVAPAPRAQPQQEGFW